MIYLRNTTDPQIVLLPLEAWNGNDFFTPEEHSGEATWKAMFDNKDIVVGEDPDEAYPSEFGHYLRLSVILPEGLADGSYELTLEVTAPASMVGRQTFVVQVGDYDAEKVEYEKTIEYEQYF